MSQDSSLRAEITSIRYVEPLKFASDQGKMVAHHHHHHHHDDEQSDGSLTTASTTSSSDVSDSNHDEDNAGPLSTSIQDPPTSLISRLVLEPDPSLNRRRRRSVHFNNEVSIVPIPSRTSYTPYLRSRLFIGKKEMTRNARRNEREFSYEGFDWRNAVEEDQMYSSLQMESGELVHPANYVCSSSSSVNERR